MIFGSNSDVFTLIASYSSAKNISSQVLSFDSVFLDICEFFRQISVSIGVGISEIDYVFLVSEVVGESQGVVISATAHAILRTKS